MPKINDEGGVWRTVSGRRIFIKDGQELSDAMRESGKFDTERQSNISKKYKLTEEEKRALQSYISSESYKINDKLRRGMSLTENDKIFVTHLNNALDKLPNYKGNVIRDLYFLHESDYDYFIQMHERSKEIDYHQFVSCTTKSSYHDNPHVRLSIKSETGKNLTGYNGSESEVLYKLGAKFKVLSLNSSDDMIIIDLEEAGYERKE